MPAESTAPRLISSAANPLIKRMRLLSAGRKHRRREGVFVAEGIQPVWQAVEAGADIEVLVIAPGLLGDSPAARMAAAAEDAGTKVVRVTGELFARLSGRDGPSGLAAIVRGRPARLADLAVGPDAVFAGLYGSGNPGNLGTVIRTANAAGAAGVILLGDTADPFSPAAVKASMGALFTTPVAQEAGAESLFGWAAAAGVTVVTTSAAAPASFWEASYPRPLVVLLGAEGPGLPEEVIARGDACVRIPMAGTAESLNLAVAASLLLYEVQRPVLARLPAPAAPEDKPAPAARRAEARPAKREISGNPGKLDGPRLPVRSSRRTGVSGQVAE
jgi:TrmH family RNA methyltransferase